MRLAPLLAAAVLALAGSSAAQQAMTSGSGLGATPTTALPYNNATTALPPSSSGIPVAPSPTGTMSPDDSATLDAARTHTNDLRMGFIAATSVMTALCLLLGVPFAVWFHRAVEREVGGGRGHGGAAGAQLPSYVEEELPKYEVSSPRSSVQAAPSPPPARRGKIVTVASLLFARLPSAAAQATATTDAPATPSSLSAVLSAESNKQALYAMGIVLGVIGPPLIVGFFVLVSAIWLVSFRWSGVVTGWNGVAG
ncbi:uncharacterized protein LOC62_05G007257 [Vanrija pseudolonga]|uniref:Uncharacterized protein n=1 Tax=Vanrija pseudolonga TaxID=143232 RepID=A0AAF0YF59_9TREE|nr:hypothetical protein LOC62_05G007257 [Vanrija pseudolonga]